MRTHEAGIFRRTGGTVGPGERGAVGRASGHALSEASPGLEAEAFEGCWAAHAHTGLVCGDCHRETIGKRVVSGRGRCLMQQRHPPRENEHTPQAGVPRLSLCMARTKVACQQPRSCEKNVHRPTVVQRNAYGTRHLMDSGRCAACVGQLVESIRSNGPYRTALPCMRLHDL